VLLAYVGTHYKGWQGSIEKKLSSALETLLQHPVALQAASRTDAGVHAWGQVVNFFSSTELPLNRMQHRLNQLLPPDIVVRSLSLEDPSFHPTLDARGKEYLYTLCSGPVQLPYRRAFSWHVPDSLNLESMHAASRCLLGSHDFSAFCNERALWDRSSLCTLETIEILPLEGGQLKILLKGDHFLYKMVRNLVGTLVSVGRGQMKEEETSVILKSLDRTRAPLTAPAHGLRLEQVWYSQRG
jgi:tRNA pseudouridine38-40 synthase